MPTTWAVVPTRLPLVVRRCHGCASERFRTHGKFRVNANHKLLDAWLLALCTVCEATTKLTVFERRNVRSVRSELLDRLHHNDPGLAAEVLQDPILRRRNRIGLDWDHAWRLDTGGPQCPSEAPGDTSMQVAVRFEAPIPVWPIRLIAEGLELTRSQVEQLVSEGRLEAVIRLDSKRSSDFAFTLKRCRLPDPGER